MNLNTFISRFFGRDESEGSKNAAKERLRLVLVHDRLDVSEKVMNALRVDLIELIGKYFGIDDKAVEVSLSREADGMALVANIPIRRHLPEVFSAEAEEEAAETKADTDCQPLPGAVKTMIEPLPDTANTMIDADKPPSFTQKPKAQEQRAFLDLDKKPKPAAPKQGGGNQNGSKQGKGKKKK